MARAGPVDMLAPGSIVGGFTIKGAIGSGAMGAVYAARHRWLGRPAAVKILHDDVHLLPQVRERLLHEARIVAGLRHPNIVEVLDAGEHEGVPYLVMELLHGQTLGERMDAGRLSPLESIAILRQVCAALRAAHACGVIHRDLKPDNIFLAGSTVKVLDWGVARSLGLARRLTSEGSIVGTPEYMAPEQCCAGELDARSDIYSLGVVAWEMFLEDVPFGGDTAVDVLAGHIARDPELPRTLWPKIPAQLESLLLAMLAKRPADRPTVGEVLAALDQAELELEARRTGLIELRRRKRRRSSGAAAGFLMAAAITLAALYAAVGAPATLAIDVAAWAGR
ncbi:MAG TPA: serine/threonine-protein kinase [Haliangiales bacterium]|nr:serine/threonine-protein kinase [Haliangiales bacterium]